MRNKHDTQEYSTLLSVDELHQELHSISDDGEVTRIGLSKGNNPVFCGKYGSGKKHALLIGFPHPNEPVGSLTCLTWIKILRQNKQLLDDYTWHIIPCIDPDGAKLNEGWFKGTFSIKKYAHAFYRQIERQIEWSFPVTYKTYSFNEPTHETKILMKLIDELNPSLIYSLHNSSFSGAYFLQSKNIGPQHIRSVKSLCKKFSIPLHKGKKEVPFIQEFATSFYKLFGIKEEFDFLKKIHLDPKKFIIGGDSSAMYAKQRNRHCYSMVCEIPYIYDPTLSDNTLSNTSNKEALQIQLEDNVQVHDFLSQRLSNPHINKKSLFYKVCKENQKVLNRMIGSQEAELKTLSEEQATNAQVFSSDIINKFYRTLFLGEFRRLLLESHEHQAINKMLKETEKTIENRINYIENNSSYQIISIKNLVQMQIAYLKSTLKYL